MRHHLRHPLAVGESEAGREAKSFAGIDKHLGGWVEVFFRAVGAVQVETHAGIAAHQFQPVAIDGDEVVLTCRKLVVRLVAVGRARLDAEADVSGTRLGVVVQLIGLVHGTQVCHPLFQLRRGAKTGGECMAFGIELLVQALEGAVEGDLRPSETEINVEALLDGVVDLPLEEIEGVDKCLGAVLAPFLYDPAGDVLDVERTLPYDAPLVALVAGQVALADADMHLAKGLR